MAIPRLLSINKTNVLVMLVLFFGFIGSTHAQDSTAVAKHSAKDFGLMCGASWVGMLVSSQDYFNAATQQMVKAKGSQMAGASVGMFYNIAFTPNWMIRPSVEAHLSNNSVRYEIGKNTETYWVYPLSVELPVTLLYGINQRMPIEQKGWKGMGLIAGVRPVFPVSIFNSNYPATQSFTLNAELGISLPKALRKTVWRTEFIASFNVLGIQAKGEAEDFRSNMINDLRRHFIGVRLYFN